MAPAAPAPSPARIAREAVALGKKMGLDKKPVCEPTSRAPDDPPPVRANGTAVRVTHGDVPQMRKDDAIVGERRADGVRGRIDGAPYVAVGGPHKGELIQPIREEGTGAVLGVPSSRLEDVSGAGSAARVGYSRRYEAAFEDVFGKDRTSSRDGWEEISPGRWRKKKE